VATPESILVADGSRDCADAVAMMLAASGMRPTVAYDGQVAIALGTRERFDAAVMDLTMPGATGFAVASELRRVHGDSIKLIAYTAWPDSVAQKQHGWAAFDEVISKSSQPWELLRAVSPECYGAFLHALRARIRAECRDA
jgi:DNA-binding response OmpR family regulator